MNTSFEGHFKWPGEGWLIPQLFCRQWREEHQQQNMMAGKKNLSTGILQFPHCEKGNSTVMGFTVAEL